MAYLMSCPACAFQQVVSDLREGQRLKERHEASYGANHTVEFEAISGQELF